MATFDVVFSSGGTKAVAFAGAVEVLVQKKHTIRRLVGTSAGGISVALLGAGFSIGELLDIFSGKQGKSLFAGFIQYPDAVQVLEAVQQEDSETRLWLKQAISRTVDQSIDALVQKTPKLALGLKVALGLVPRDELYEKAYKAFFDVRPDNRTQLIPLLAFLEFGGFLTSDPIVKWLSETVREKLPKFPANGTFAQFHEMTGRDMSIVAADTTAKIPLILNHRTAPDCPVFEAVRMSMSIPMVWPEVAWQAGWGKYQGNAITGHYIVDGGAMLNLPIHLFAEANEERVKRVMGDPPAGAALPLGLLLDEMLPVAGDVAKPELPTSKLIGRMGRLIDTVTRWEDDVIRRHEAVVCRIPSLGYSAVEFATNPERLEVLINSGRCAMQEHLQQRKIVG